MPCHCLHSFIAISNIHALGYVIIIFIYQQFIAPQNIGVNKNRLLTTMRQKICSKKSLSNVSSLIGNALSEPL